MPVRFPSRAPPVSIAGRSPGRARPDPTRPRTVLRLRRRLLVVALGAAALAGARPGAALQEEPADPSEAPAETAAENDSARWEISGLPALNFDADEGVGYGVVGGLYRHAGEGSGPYLLALEPTLFFTTGGRRELTLFADAPGRDGDAWRLDGFLGAERHIALPYYGLGNDPPYDPAREEEESLFYRFGRERLRVAANLQWRLAALPVRLLLGAGAARTAIDPLPQDAGTTLLAEHLGRGEPLDPSHTRHVRAGVVWDTRDHETVPRRGVWSELLVQVHGRLLGGDHGFTRWTLADRRYRPLGPVTLANRLLLQEVRGDAPFHELYRIQTSFRQQEGLGGAETLRGIPQNRYAGRGLFLWNLEVRWEGEEVRVFGLGIRPGALAFVDSGRAWEDGVRGGELLRDLHHALGGGLRLRMGEAFVVAGDVGHSSESTLSVYIGIGHLF